MPAMPNAFAEEATDFCITLENKSDPSELGANTFNWHLMMLSLYIIKIQHSLLLL